MTQEEFLQPLPRFCSGFFFFTTHPSWKILPPNAAPAQHTFNLTEVKVIGLFWQAKPQKSTALGVSQRFLYGGNFVGIAWLFLDMTKISCAKWIDLDCIHLGHILFHSYSQGEWTNVWYTNANYDACVRHKLNIPPPDGFGSKPQQQLRQRLTTNPKHSDFILIVSAVISSNATCCYTS